MKTLAFGKNSTPELKKEFHETNRLYSALKRLDRKKKAIKSIEHEENMYLSNFWDFSKRLIKGELYKEAVRPAFTQDEANKYYTDKYSQDIAFDPSQLNWFPYIRMPRNYISFDMSISNPKM